LEFRKWPYAAGQRPLDCLSWVVLMRDLRRLCCGRGRWTGDRRSVLEPQMGWRLQ
jgi:hypothetical protein